MNYWHIQMNQPWGRNSIKIDPVAMLRETVPVIGTGNWDDEQCRNFTDEKGTGMKVGDIVMVRDGKDPIALCEVYSESFRDSVLEAKYKNQNYRHVKVLSFRDEDAEDLLHIMLSKYNKSYIQASGTLTKCVNNNATKDFIREWNKLYNKKQKMQNIKTILKYKKQIILQGPPGTGKTREAELIAKEMLGLSDIKQLENNDQYKLVQFHPSYTYEDFVRGISAIPSEDGKGILYKAENKILSLFAQEAYKNYEQSTKTESQISYKDWIDDQFDNFIDTVQASIDNSGEYRLTDKVKLFDLDASSFYYTGDSWFGEPKHRMKFSDIKEGYINNVVDAKSFKALPNTSGSAKQHYGYYYKVLSDFQNSIKTEFKNENKILSETKNYVLVIDEINRANLSSVLGELIYALEYREKAVESMYSVEDSVLDNKYQIMLPPNLFIIGTMNTADRSVGHIDYAIRRRFAFVEVPPKRLADNDEIYFNVTGYDLVAELFTTTNVSSEFEIQDVQIGHSYFIADKIKAKDETARDAIFNMKMQYEVLPILEEYVKDGILMGEVENKPIRDYIRSLKKVS
ncbi:McrB family protein [Kaistella solincola]|uniref:McrB family protein n=1 Tax=Kaistella solincola TaxID=510955 RepID=UPI00068C7BA3|nr:AAA family ATPase [Kaistella solincola]